MKKISKKKAIMAVIMAFVATVIVTGLTAFKADAAGNPKMARCFNETPTLKGVKWQVASDYWQGLYPPESANPALLQKFSLDYYVTGSVKANIKPGATKTYAKFAGKTVTKVRACYESYIWTQMYSQEDGKPMYYSDGSPVLYQRVVDSHWESANPRAVFAWNWDQPKIGQRGKMLVAWVVGGK